MSFKIIMTTSVTRPCFTTHQTCKTKTKADFFWSEADLVLRPTVSDHITAPGTESMPDSLQTTPSPHGIHCRLWSVLVKRYEHIWNYGYLSEKNWPLVTRLSKLLKLVETETDRSITSY